jgi:tRNA A-37 threonylcarbamoyl transferase component Bud32
MEEWTNYFWADLHWVVKKGKEAFVRQVWETAHAPRTLNECKVLKDSILRSSLLVPVADSDPPVAFLKRHRRRHWQDDLKSLVVPSRAFIEWKLLRHLRHLGITAPEPLAYAERRTWGVLRDSCLITEALDDALPLKAFVPATWDSPATGRAFEQKRTFWTLLGGTIAHLHERGIYFRDLHDGNILCRRAPGNAVELFFIDPAKARCRSRLTTAQRVRDLASLRSSPVFGSTASWLRFLKSYLAASGVSSLPWKEFFRTVEKIQQAAWERHLKSRNKRCLKKTTGFNVTRHDNETCYFRREFPEDLVLLALQKSSQQSSEGSGHCAWSGNIGSAVIKDLPSPSFPTVRVTRYYYSWWQQVKSLLFWSAAKKAWFNANGLVVRDVSTPLPLALVEKRGLLGVRESTLLDAEPAGAEDRSSTAVPKSPFAPASGRRHQEEPLT